MMKFNHRNTRIGAAMVAGVVVAGGALAVSLTGSAKAAPDVLTHHVSGEQIARVQLTSMPQGTVKLGWDRSGHVDATVNAYGLTPGSSHAVELVNRDGREVTSFGTLTANSVGQASEGLDSWYKHDLDGSRLVILNGTAGDSVSAEPIAETQWDVQGGGHWYRLTSVEVSADGTSYGTPQGWATVTYDPNAKTISVTVNASGVTPGAHAAHIHIGSCASQGNVKYMLMDFTANDEGQIVHETRTVTDATPLPASGWYLNLHQGNGNNILDAAGNPTINFRPLICGNIVPQS
jgi:Cu/Zn superoxide dismutase